MLKKYPFTALSLLLALPAFAVVPTLALTFDTNVRTYGMSSSQEAKIQSAERKIRDVIASEAFRTRVLNHTYKGKKTFVDNMGLTNAQIYNKILAGAERLSPSKDNQMDLKIKVYYQNSNVVGYTTPKSDTINMNTKFLNKYSATNVTRNMIHEWLHKVGFDHAKTYSTARDYSVPYAIGSIMEKLAAQY